MIDSRGLIHVPRPVRLLALGLLTVAFLGAVAFAVTYARRDNPADPKFSDWVLIGMSLAQLSLSGLAAALILFFSEREVGSQALLDKTESVLAEQLPDVLARVSPAYALRHQRTEVTRLGRSDIFGAAYELASGGHTMKLWVGINVSRIIVIYLLHAPPGTDMEGFAQQARQLFRFTLGGAEKAGYHTSLEPVTLPNGAHALSVWSVVNTDANLLVQPSERLFWFQDVAMMTESFWRTAVRGGLFTSAEDPGPL